MSLCVGRSHNLFYQYSSSDAPIPVDDDDAVRFQSQDTIQQPQTSRSGGESFQFGTSV